MRRRCCATRARDAREEILRAARELFARHGFRRTSIEAIARAARVSMRCVHLHFSSKEELFTEVARRTSDGALEAVATAVRRARTPADKLRAFIDASIEVLPAIAAEHGLSEETMTELISLGMAVRQAHLARQRSMLLDLLRAGVASGAFEVEHPERLATGIVVCLEALDAVAARRRPDAVRAGFDELLSVILRGMSPTERARTAREEKACPG